MYAVKGKLENGQTISGNIDAQTPGEAIDAVHKHAEANGQHIVKLTVTKIGDSNSIKIAKPRARKPSKSAEAAAPATPATPSRRK